jgi:hypothetical protein
LETVEAVRCNGLRGLFWLVFLSSLLSVGRRLVLAGLEGG